MSEFTKPVLAFESALGGCIVAVLTASGKSFARALATEREQAAKLVPLIQDVMDEAGVAFADLGLIVTTTGPGSFTGLRISLSTARAMGLSLGLPVQGVSTFEVMAKSCGVTGRALVVLESKRADFYVQAMDGCSVGNPVCLEAQAVAEAAQGRVVCGDALPRLRAETGQAFEASVERVLLDPVVLAKVGLERFIANGQKAARPEPLYLRNADVSVSNKLQREINFPQ